MSASRENVSASRENVSAPREKEIRVVVHASDAPTAERLEGRVCLPNDAGFEEFIDALKAEAPAVYREVRRRVLRAAGRVLAYGRDDPLLIDIDQKLSDGGTLVFPAEDVWTPVAAEELTHAQSVN